MAENKTQRNTQSVQAFLDQVPDEQKRLDSYKILELMKNVTQEEPAMWGDAIVGFGSVHYKYASGREGDMPVTGFSPRKQNLALYVLGDFDADELLKKLGKHKTGKVCLYINKLKDVDEDVLRKLVEKSIEAVHKHYPG